MPVLWETVYEVLPEQAPLASVLRRLPLRSRAILILRANGLGWREIGRVIGRHPQQVQRDFTLAVRQARELVDDQEWRD